MPEADYRATYGFFAYLRRFFSLVLFATAVGIIWIPLVLIYFALQEPAREPEKSFAYGLSLYLFWSAAFFGGAYGQYLSPAATNGRSQSYFFLHVLLSWCWAMSVAAIFTASGAADLRAASIPLRFLVFGYVVFCPLIAISTARSVRSNHMYWMGYFPPWFLFGNDPDFRADLKLAYEERKGVTSYRYW